MNKDIIIVINKNQEITADIKLAYTTTWLERWN